MPKAKATSKSKVIPKLAPSKSLSGLKVIALTVLGAFLLVGGYLYSTMEKSGINEIREAKTMVSEPMVKPDERMCEKVTSLNLSEDCGEGKYQKAQFACGNKDWARTIGGSESLKGQKDPDRAKSNCKPVSELYAEARKTCVASCPSPSPTPKQTPSREPSDGCYYKDVVCAKGPCPQIKVCPDQTRGPKATETPTSTPTSTAVPTSCARQSVEWVSYSTSCAQFGSPDKYQLVSFRCGGETNVRTISRNALCNTKATLSSWADQECKKNTCN